MSDKPDVTVKTVHRKKKPVLLEDIQGTQQPRSSTGPGRAMDIPGYPADPGFQLRGGFANLMLDAANPLFGLVIRLRTLDDLPNIEQVHKTLQTQVSAIREEIQQ
ncbi:DotU family type IV/VI secretion system protein, partial [Pseudomonas putida]|nr:DotU family type IV/VI secretion system protein [Pseudomonas putida]MBF8715830.1 DotU family type IV/VI secretion system protein [Pseudomonas putida]